MSSATEQVLEDVILEHLDEAAYALIARAALLHSPSYTLNELASGLEERLLAHVDGLAVAAQAGRAIVLEPELVNPEEPSSARATAACLGLLAQGREDLVARALWSAVPTSAEGAQCALTLAASPQFDTWLVAQLSAELAPQSRCTLLQLAANRGLPVSNVLMSLQSENPLEMASAAKAARRAPAALHIEALESLVDHDDPQVRHEATLSALVHGSLYAFERCLTRVRDDAASDAQAMLLIALLGSSHHQETLVALLASSKHVHDALFALGFTGNVRHTPVLLAWMRSGDKLAARLASEAYMGITGLDTTQAPYAIEADDALPDGLPPLEQDDLDLDLVPTAALELPLPNSEAVGSFHAHYEAGEHPARSLHGLPWTIANALRTLEHVSLRRRHALAIWLEIRTGGAVRVDSYALSAVQRSQYEAARSFESAPFVRTYG
jgi:uncharacterized protein (TIGR02270 family)